MTYNLAASLFPLIFNRKRLAAKRQFKPDFLRKQLFYFNKKVGRNFTHKFEFHAKILTTLTAGRGVQSRLLF